MSIGKIVNVQDTEQKGMVQVRIYPELVDVPEAELPWATPLFSTNVHKVPPVGSFVRLEISDDWTSFKYYPIAPFAKSTYPYDKIKEIIKGRHTYPEPIAMMTTDKSVLFYDQTTQECGIVHSSGTKITLDKTGHVKIEGVTDIQLGGNTDDGVLYSALATILNAVISHTHVVSTVVTGTIKGTDVDGTGAGTASASTELATVVSDTPVTSIKSTKVKLI